MDATIYHGTGYLPYTMEHQDDTDREFLKDLLPWSDQIPEICKIKTKT